MQIDKNQILELLRSQGKHDTAAQADSTLPDTVDTERDANLLERIGLTPQEIIGALTGGGGIGGIAGRLAGAAGSGNGGGDGDAKDEGGLGGALGGLLGR